MSISPAKKAQKTQKAVVELLQPRLLCVVPFADLVIVGDLSLAIKKLLEIAKTLKMVKKGSQYVYATLDNLEVELCQVVTGKVYQIRLRKASGAVSEAVFKKIV